MPFCLVIVINSIKRQCPCCLGGFKGWAENHTKAQFLHKNLTRRSPVSCDSSKDLYPWSSLTLTSMIKHIAKYYNPMNKITDCSTGGESIKEIVNTIVIYYNRVYFFIELEIETSTSIAIMCALSHVRCLSIVLICRGMI